MMVVGVHRKTKNCDCSVHMVLVVVLVVVHRVVVVVVGDYYQSRNDIDVAVAVRRVVCGRACCGGWSSQKVPWVVPMHRQHPSSS